MSKFTDVTAVGFNRPWDGEYTLFYPDKWTNGDYWIYHDSYLWYVSESQYLYSEQFVKATRDYDDTQIVDPKGNYIGASGNPNGSVV